MVLEQHWKKGNLDIDLTLFIKKKKNIAKMES